MIQSYKSYDFGIFVLPSFQQFQFMDKQMTNKLLYREENQQIGLKTKDAVVSAPDNHKILLENDKSRVFAEVTLGPKELEPAHHHRWPSVFCLL
ncbi:MAG: hypothetical protein IPL22_22525 [Bacteroidetes bacterium]|nr:hypothetical protein [Bacteroidota bacterium]